MALDIVLASSAQAVVTVGAVTVYPNGFEFEYLVRTKDERLAQLLPEYLHRQGFGGDESELPPELFRFGLEFADGSRVTSIQPTHPLDSASTETKGSLLVPRGGGGSLERWHSQWWVWPLPPEGPLAFVCEWPAAAISLTRAEINAALLRGAASRVQILWEDERSTSSAGYGYSFIQAVRADPEESDK